MTRVIGADVSSWQGDINWPVMAGFAKFIIIRAGTSISQDAFFSANWAGAKAVGLPRGSYWTLWPPSVAPIVSQANKYIEAIQGDPGELRPFVAAEVDGLTKGDISIFCDHVFAGVGQHVWVYTRDNIWSTYPGTFTGPGKLWEAEYPYISWQPNLFDLLQNEEPHIHPHWWPTWKFWQITDKAPGSLAGVSSNTFDVTWYNGDLAAFYADPDFNIQPPEDPAPPEEQYAEWVGNGGFIRDEQNKVLGAMWESNGKFRVLSWGDDGRADIVVRAPTAKLQVVEDAE